MINYKQMFSFARNQIKNNKRKSEIFRDRFEHTLRVLKWAERINKFEGGNMEIIKIACIFHDVGWDEKMPHAIVSEQIANKYLTKICYDNYKKFIVLEAIRSHSSKDENLNLFLESKILMDADMLDETGALNILWCSMITGSQPSPSYRKAYDRISQYYHLMHQKKEYLKTATGRRLYDDRLRCVESFLKCLDFEMQTSNLYTNVQNNMPHKNKTR